MTDDPGHPRPANPTYGDGYFVRTTRFRRLAPDRIEAVLEDPFHALALRIQHDDRALTAIEGRWERHPLTSCAGAGSALAGLAGLRLIGDLRTRWLQAEPTLHCTHMFDTLRLAAVHIAQARDDRRHDVILPDSDADKQPVQLLQDGALVLEIMIDADFHITAPAAYAGAPLLKGFARWAAERLSAVEFERLFLIQRGAFVGRGRRMDIAQYYGRDGALSGPLPATCFGSQPERYPTSLRLANARAGLRRKDAALFPFTRAQQE
ncbi:DUF2889 domain-containing protein [Sphingopyxis macrogoltabida]|uniref:DUF2889 domain-containing protein n=1 Tax=Sphingopyxis macrogoltabida TaxID=33050 RepID=A0A0N9UE51_SPHMC|nr:DUF2889 domain-containing protein [Sphingopyxis macrogoltabida]ALH81671.1 hypothetical protein AN936_15310 [Sphingopyxis macrogoltabida]